MTDEAKGPDTEQALDSTQPEGQPADTPAQPGAGGEDTPDAGPGEQPADDMVSAAEVQRRLSRLQKAFERKFQTEAQARQQAEAKTETLREQYDAMVTKDMPEAERLKYELGKKEEELQQERQQRATLEERELERKANRTWIRWYVEEIGVPQEVFAEAETYEEIQDAFANYAQGGQAFERGETPATPPSSGPTEDDKVHTATGASTPGTEFEEEMDAGIMPGTSAWKKVSQKIKRAREIV